jgi:hypothetical protein
VNPRPPGRIERISSTTMYSTKSRWIRTRIPRKLKSGSDHAKKFGSCPKTRRIA